MMFSRSLVLDTLARLEQAGLLPSDGPTSVFLRGKQLAVQASCDSVLVRTSRLPFSRPMAFTRAEVRAASEAQR